MKEIRDKVYEEISGYITMCISDSAAEVLPYWTINNDSNLSRMIKEKFKIAFSEDELLFMVSNSILAKGKSGAVFTLDKVYYKGWGGFDTYSCSHSDYFYSLSNYKMFYLGDADGDYFTLQFLMKKINDEKIVTERRLRRKKILDSSSMISNIGTIVTKLFEIFQEAKEEKKIAEFIYQVAFTFNQENKLSLNTEKTGYGEVLEQISDWIKDLQQYTIYVTSDEEEYYPKAVSIILFFLKFYDKFGEILGKILPEKILEEIEFNCGFVAFYSCNFLDEELWETLEETELKKYCDSCLCDIEKTLRCITEYIKEKESDEQIEREAMDFAINLFRDSQSILPKELDDFAKNEINNMKKVQSKLNKANVPERVHTIVDISDAMFQFANRLPQVMGVESFGFKRNVDFPKLVIELNKFFCSGIIISEQRILWRYLNGSPEQEILDLLGQKYEYEGEREIENITKIGYVSNIKFVMLKVEIGGVSYYYPITRVEAKYAKTIGIALGELLKINIEKVELPKEHLEKIGAIYNTTCEEVNKDISKINETMEQVKDDIIDDFNMREEKVQKEEKRINIKKPFIFRLKKWVGVLTCIFVLVSIFMVSYDPSYEDTAINIMTVGIIMGISYIFMWIVTLFMKIWAKLNKKKYV